LLTIGLAAAAEGQTACPPDGRCHVDNGYYRIVTPPGWDGQQPLGALLFFHGWQGTAEDVVADAAFVAAVHRLGLALVAPNGEGKTWSYPGSPGAYRDEFAFVTAILADLPRRLPLDQERLIGSGFSQGGSMAWYVACRLGNRFAAFVPFAGAFWHPMPDRCEHAVNLVHIHGTTDGTVPMGGRALRGGAFRQGDVRAGFATMLAAAACPTPKVRMEQRGELACEIVDGCASGTSLRLCLHSGGHIVEPAWLDLTADWLRAQKP
jgi:polyhydroxybutyrate depolymerase